MVSFQRVTLESRNFIKLVSIKVMLKYGLFMERLDPSVKHWDDKRGCTGMTRGGLLG
ncbi:MAG: hypothetical protein ACR5K9_00505 [Wolbachia sp.]